MKNDFEVVSLNESESMILNCIRRNNGLFTKAELAENLNVPWSTVSTSVTSLLKRNMVIVENNHNNKSYKGKLFINSSHKFYVGVSIGHSKIKIVIMDFAFDILKESDILKIDSQTGEQDNEIYCIMNKFCDKLSYMNFEKDNSQCYKWCCPTPNTIPEIREKMMQVTRAIIDLKKSNFYVDAIGIALPGHINFDSQKIVKSFEDKSDCFLNTTIASILSTSLINELADNSIKVYIDHNVKSSTIGEKEAMLMYRKEIDQENILNLYLGVGLSLGIIYNNRLCRGTANLAGEVGKCIDTKNDITLEKKLNKIIYKNSNKEWNDKCIDNFAENDEIDTFVDLLCVSLSNLVSILGITMIVCSGKFEKIFPCIELKMMNKFLDMKKAEINLIKSYYGEYSAAIGCAIEAYYNVHNLPIQWNVK